MSTRACEHQLDACTLRMSHSTNHGRLRRFNGDGRPIQYNYAWCEIWVARWFYVRYSCPDYGWRYLQRLQLSAKRWLGEVDRTGGEISSFYSGPLGTWQHVCSPTLPLAHKKFFCQDIALESGCICSSIIVCVPSSCLLFDFSMERNTRS